MHRATCRRGKPVWDEEEAFRRFNEVIDFELYCLELEYSDKIGAMIREGVKRRLDGKQKAFEAMLARQLKSRPGILNWRWRMS